MATCATLRKASSKSSVTSSGVCVCVKSDKIARNLTSGRSCNAVELNRIIYELAPTQETALRRVGGGGINRRDDMIGSRRDHFRFRVAERQWSTPGRMPGDAVASRLMRPFRQEDRTTDKDSLNHSGGGSPSESDHMTSARMPGAIDPSPEKQNRVRKAIGPRRRRSRDPRRMSNVSDSGGRHLVEWPCHGDVPDNIGDNRRRSRPNGEHGRPNLTKRLIHRAGLEHRGVRRVADADPSEAEPAVTGGARAVRA